MTTTRALAVAAYLAAVAAPASADWRAVADALHAALPAVRGAAAKPADAPGTAPKWFADWKLGKVYSLDSVVVTFADGVAIRCNLAKAPGKLPRVAASCRTAVAFYRARTGRDSVPAFVSIVAASDGQEFDAEACSELTADLRRTAIVPRAVRPVVTAESLAKMERELERRRGGVARLDRRAAVLERIRLWVVESCGHAVELLSRKAQLERNQWDSAARDAEFELAGMRAALDSEPAAPVSEPVQAEPCAAQPVAAVAATGSPSVSSASRIARSATSCGATTPIFFASPTVTIDTAVTSEPVPAVVGICTSGRRDTVTLFTPYMSLSAC